MNITYRKLTAVNAPSYRAIRLESIKAHPESFCAVYEEQKQLPKLMFEQALENGVTLIDSRFVVGAFDGDTLIGICGFVPLAQDGNAGELIQVYVRAAYSGRKIGLGLVKTAVSQAFTIPSIQQIILDVKKGNTNAIRVYEQAGFQPHIATKEIAGMRDDAHLRMSIKKESASIP